MDKATDSLFGAFLPKFTGLLLAVLMLLSVVLACRSSSTSSGAKCMGEVTYEGKTYTGGPTSTAEEAQKFACNNYCLDADPEFDAHYRIWNDSRYGEAAGHPSKKEAIYKDKDLLDYLTKDCAEKCIASIQQGKLKGSTKCQ